MIVFIVCSPCASICRRRTFMTGKTPLLNPTVYGCQADGLADCVSDHSRSEAMAGLSSDALRCR